MSRKARALPSPVLDDTSVSTISMADRWRVLFGSEPPRAERLVAQAIAWKEQVLTGGDVAPTVAHDLAIAARHATETRSRRAGSEIEPDAAPCSISKEREASSPSAAPCSRSRAAVAPLPPASSQLLPGTRLVKAHGGRNHVVEVTGSGFLYEGEPFASLSAIAKHITGTHWNGLLFFGLRRRKTYPARVAGHG